MIGRRSMSAFMNVDEGSLSNKALGRLSEAETSTARLRALQRDIAEELRGGTHKSLSKISSVTDMYINRFLAAGDPLSAR